MEIEVGQIAQAAAILRRGGLVAFPTETVYGLGANALDTAAVRRIFEVKQRPATSPLIVHAASETMARAYAAVWSPAARDLARRFWPGPLTIIVPASARVPLKLTGNTGRLALRQSRSKVANQLIALLNQPLISTSANISGSPTCRSGIDVFGMMDGRVDLVIDGGMCNGAGATTVDITEPSWRLIRAGAIEEKEIAECLQ